MPAPALSRRAGLAQGQPISQLMHMALERPELISLAAGFVDQETLPVEETREAAQWLLSQPEPGRAALQYGTTAGFLPLRERVLAEWQAADGHPHALRGISADRVVLTAGSNQLLHLLADTLCDPGDIVLCAAPTYFVFIGLAANLGVRTVGVATDGEGLIPEALDEQLAAFDKSGELARVKAIYVNSFFDNPASITLSRDRRPQVVEIARRWSRRRPIFVIEDAAYRQLRYEGESFPSLLAFDDGGGTVIATQTFSKSFSPGLRVGYGILPAPLVEPLLAQKGNIDFGSPNFNQQLAWALYERGLLERHVGKLRETYRAKRDAMLKAAETHLAPLGCRWRVPRGGLYVWLTLPEGIDADIGRPLYEESLRQGVLYVPGHFCYAREGFPVQKSNIRLSFGVQPAERIAEGIAALAAALRRRLEDVPACVGRSPDGGDPALECAVEPLAPRRAK
ncbi:MAG: PLP-dependent aminotransferase family protein [Planctomycetia bacterium]|nr:PLP-dependent aminotransferase family protein [Planctomycetia bacterium]